MEIIANDCGNRTTPSYVAFTDTQRLVGDAATNLSLLHLSEPTTPYYHSSSLFCLTTTTTT